MQTMYYTTDRFVRRTGNVVDLNEYRRRLAQAQQLQDQQADDRQETAVCAARPRRSDVRRRQGLLLDACASMGIVVMTLTFTLHVLGL